MLCVTNLLSIFLFNMYTSPKLGEEVLNYMKISKKFKLNTNNLNSSIGFTSVENNNLVVHKGKLYKVAISHVNYGDINLAPGVVHSLFLESK